MDQYGFSNGQNGGMNQNNMGTPNYTNNGGNAPDYMLWLILGIVQICSLCCCNCVGCVFGIITTVFVYTANNCFKNGDMMNYQSKMKTAKIINIIGWCIICFGIIMGIIGSITGAFSQFTSNLNY